MNFSCQKNFLMGADIRIEVKVKVIYESNTDDIFNQYIVFSKIYNEQRKLYGSTKKAVTETIRICKSQNVLKEYLAEREKEVVTIMMSLFDEEQIMRSYIRSERHDADIETAKRLLKMGKLSFEEIASGTGLTVEEIEKIEVKVTN